MSDPIREFEDACAAAGVSPSAAFRAGGLNPSTWFRWKSQETSPTLRSLAAAKDGLAKLMSEAAATVAPDSGLGAEKIAPPFSPTGGVA